jgi:hypothetical protein
VTPATLSLRRDSDTPDDLPSTIIGSRSLMIITKLQSHAGPGPMGPGPRAAAEASRLGSSWPACRAAGRVSLKVRSSETEPQALGLRFTEPEAGDSDSVAGGPGRSGSDTHWQRQT